MKNNNLKNILTLAIVAQMVFLGALKASANEEPNVSDKLIGIYSQTSVSNENKSTQLSLLMSQMTDQQILELLNKIGGQQEKLNSIISQLKNQLRDPSSSLDDLSVTIDSLSAGVEGFGAMLYGFSKTPGWGGAGIGMSEVENKAYQANLLKGMAFFAVLETANIVVDKIFLTKAHDLRVENQNQLHKEIENVEAQLGRLDLLAAELNAKTASLRILLSKRIQDARP